MSTGIEWTDETWNPVTGCDHVSPGCDHCYAERMAVRLAGRAGYPADEPFRVTLHPDRLDQPSRWRKPRRVFVNSMSDLFHRDVPDEFIAEVFAVMGAAEQHTFQVLTKRPQRMARLLSSPEWSARLVHDHGIPAAGRGPFPNVWLGTSVENQRYAELRIPHLLATPAAVRFLSIEPLLGPISLRWAKWHDYYRDGWRERGEVQDEYDGARRLDWVIVGGESGPGARPMHPAWVRTLRDHCTAAGVPFFFKQWGAWGPEGPLDARPSSLALDGTLYAPGELSFPDGPRWGEALRAGHGDGQLVATYRAGKKVAGRELDGRTWDEAPA